MAADRLDKVEKLDPPRGNWALNKSGQVSTYALALIDKNFDIDEISESSVGEFSRNISSSSPIGAPELGAVEFRFPMNPQSIQLEEPAAVTVIPTQDGGQYIEHQGQIYKNLSIKGTTGLRPNKNKGGIIPVTLNNAGQPGVERTGFDDLIDLMNLFRVYWALKRNIEFAHRIAMVWQNGREGEFFIVEPINFRTDRDAASPLTTSYEISLRTIERLDISEFLTGPTDSVIKRSAFQKVFAKIDRTRKQLADALARVQGNIDALLSRGARIFTRILRPANDVLDALAGIVSTTNRVVEIPRALISDVVDNIDALTIELEDAAISFSNNGISDQFSDAKQALHDVKRALIRIFGIDELFSSSEEPKIRKKSKAYFNSIIGIKDSGGDDLDLDNAIAGNSLSEAVVNGGDNIRKLAKRLLGSSGKWKQLVIVNNLKPPYISESGDGVDVLRPGDFIKFPSFSPKDQTGVAQTSTGKRKTLSETEEAFGRDIKISIPSSSIGTNVFDFADGESGDLETIEGLDNMAQAVRIKFETERGELPLHRTFGIKLPIGIKFAGASSFIEFQIGARASILADRRISDIGSFSVTAEGNTMRINSSILLNGFSRALPLDFDVRR